MKKFQLLGAVFASLLLATSLAYASGYTTNGLPSPTTSNNSLPFTLNEMVAFDTNLPNGQYPESEAPTLQQLTTAFGRGAVIPQTFAATIAAWDVSRGGYYSITLTGNLTITAFSNPSPGQIVDIEITQDATGSRTVTWPTNVRWASGSAPTLTTTAGHTDKISLIYNATLAKWTGSSILNIS